MSKDYQSPNFKVKPIIPKIDNIFFLIEDSGCDGEEDYYIFIYLGINMQVCYMTLEYSVNSQNRIIISNEEHDFDKEKIETIIEKHNKIENIEKAIKKIINHIPYEFENEEIEQKFYTHLIEKIKDTFEI